VAKAEEKIDIRRPGANAGQRGQEAMCVVGVQLAQTFEVEALGLDLLGEVKQCLCLGA
jgi:hypothetical protein